MPLIRKPIAPTSVSIPASQSANDSRESLQLLVSGNSEERWAAARAAVNVAGSVSALATALRSESEPKVREAIFTSLTRINSAESVNALMPLLRVESANLRTGALDALRAMPDIVGEHLPRLLSDTDSDVRLLSCEIARSLPSEQATHLLCKLLERENEVNVCAAAIEVLTEVGTADAVPVLVSCGQKFKDAPFMAFAVQIATDRILSTVQRGAPSVANVAMHQSNNPRD